MKNFKTVTFRKGAVGLLSATGEKGWWYPSKDHSVTVTEDIEAQHLFLWKNQNPYFAFRVPARVLNLKIDIPDDTDICVWFHEKSIIIEKALIDKTGP